MSIVLFSNLLSNLLIVHVHVEQIVNKIELKNK
jgi:hypothetical protein